MHYEIALNGKVYEVEVDDNRALIGAIRAARPMPPRARPAPPTGQPAASNYPVRLVAEPQRPIAAIPTPIPARAQAPHPPAALAVSAAPATTQGGEPISAPMPGMIKDIRVQPGQKVNTGQVLMILEAMKMENEIVSPKNAIITEIRVAKGQTVQPGQVLLNLQN